MADEDDGTMTEESNRAFWRAMEENLGGRWWSRRIMGPGGALEYIVMLAISESAGRITLLGGAHKDVNFSLLDVDRHFLQEFQDDFFQYEDVGQFAREFADALTGVEKADGKPSIAVVDGDSAKPTLRLHFCIDKSATGPDLRKLTLRRQHAKIPYELLQSVEPFFLFDGRGITSRRPTEEKAGGDEVKHAASPGGKGAGVKRKRDRLVPQMLAKSTKKGLGFKGAEREADDDEGMDVERG